MTKEALGPRRETTMIILLNGHSLKLPSKCTSSTHTSQTASGDPLGAMDGI